MAMLTNTNEPLSFLRYGISRKKELLRDVNKLYDGLVVPANILLYQYKSTPSVVLRCDRPFFIDPMSYLFGRPYDAFRRRAKQGTTEFKPSFARLLEGHGLDVSDVLSYKYSDMTRIFKRSKNFVHDMVDHALDFQNSRIVDSLQGAEDLLTDEDKRKLESGALYPAFVIPPYFLYDTDTESRDFFGVNEEILEYCSQEKEEVGDIFPLVFLSRRGLENDDFRESVTAMVKRHGFRGYCVWIDDFDERYVTASELTGIRSLVEALSAEGQQIVILYGGFFSLALYHFGVSCVCSGLAYGEARDISASTQQKGGPAPVRYYVRDLHTFLPLDSALALLRQRPDLLCACPVCSRVVQGDPENVTRFVNEEALAEMHFLYNRFQERKMLGQSSLEDTVEHLDWILELNDDLGQITRRNRYGQEAIIDLGFIRRWREMFAATNG
jgi:hypothetical protein